MNLFKEAENNEKQIDQKLSILAEKEINIIAKSPILIESQINNPITANNFNLI